MRDTRRENQGANQDAKKASDTMNAPKTPVKTHSATPRHLKQALAPPAPMLPGLAAAIAAFAGTSTLTAPTAPAIGTAETITTRPDGRFVNISQMVPSIVQNIRYFGEHNFMGQTVTGYLAPKCLLTVEAAAALAKVQEELLSYRFSLKVYDCYRPQRAVNHFVTWAEDLHDRKMSGEFYPTLGKDPLFKDGYIAAKSGHSRGSTLSLTIVPVYRPHRKKNSMPATHSKPAPCQLPSVLTITRWTLARNTIVLIPAPTPLIPQSVAARSATDCCSRR